MVFQGESDVMAVRVGRLIAAAAERSDVRQRIMDAVEMLCADLNSSVGAVVVMVAKPGEIPRIAEVVEGGQWPEGARDSYLAYLQDEQGGDPFYAAMTGQFDKLASAGDLPIAFARRDLVGDSNWYGSRHYNKYRGPAGMDDCIYTTAVGDAEGQFIGGSLHRRTGMPPFTPTDVRVASLVFASIRPWALALVRGQPRVVAILASLSPSKRKVLLELSGGRSIKQIADRVGLSTQTVRTYTKSIYSALNVRTRGELQAMCNREGLAAMVSKDSGTSSAERVTK